ncbi:MAG TPA: DUF4239 domain-containing protein [Thermoanaerobaculia bacterium]|nr:DUF4239 domain-containing protein [Thermoanaerobaculia bacterium]
MYLTLPHWLVVGGGIAFSILGVIIIRRFVPYEKLHENNEFTGFAYQIIGLIYGIYLAFTVVVVWQQYEDAEETATTEAVHISVLWRDSQQLRPEDRERIQLAMHVYVQSVICKEWPSLEAGNGSDPNTLRAYESLWNAYYMAKPDPNDPVQIAFYNQSVDELNDLAMARRLRLLSADAALPGVMWHLLIAGAIGTIIFTWFYATKYATVQLTVTAFLSIIIVYSVMLVSVLQHPFAGEVRVTPEAFMSIRKSFIERRAFYHLPPINAGCN